MANAYERSSTELLELRPEIWSSSWYSTLLGALPFNDSVARDYEGEIQVLGDRVHVSQFPEFAAAVDLTEAATNDTVAVTATGLDLVINHEIAQDFAITDRAMAQTLDSMNALRDLAIYSILKKVHSLIVAAVAPAGPNAIAYDTGTTLALADILEAKELLDCGNVPTGGRVAILDCAQWNDVLNISQLASSDYIASGQNPVQEGMLPARIAGFEPKMTTEATANVSYFFHPSFMQLAFQRGMSVKAYDLGVTGVRALRVNCSVLFGVAQFSNVRVVTIS
jgi:hypothetical protein